MSSNTLYRAPQEIRWFSEAPCIVDCFPPTKYDSIECMLQSRNACRSIYHLLLKRWHGTAIVTYLRSHHGKTNFPLTIISNEGKWHSPNCCSIGSSNYKTRILSSWLCLTSCTNMSIEINTPVFILRKRNDRPLALVRSLLQASLLAFWPDDMTLFKVIYYIFIFLF